MNRTITALCAALAAPLLVLAAGGCSGKVETLSFVRTTTGGLSAPLSSLSDCPLLTANLTVTTASGQVVVSRACFMDDQGNYYDALYSDGPELTPTGIPVLPGGRRYSFVVELAEAWVPATAPADVGSAYAGPDNIFSENAPCCPEDQPKNVVPTSSTLQGNVLTVSLADIVSNGNQVDVQFDCSLLWPGASQGPECGAFNGRFYVNEPPPVGGTSFAADASAE
jgi:hypothetical protein